MAAVFFYVNAGHAAVESAGGLWAERKAAANKLRGSRDSGAERDSSPSRVAAPGNDNILLAQLPSIDLNVLSNAIPKSQMPAQGLGAYEFGAAVRQKSPADSAASGSSASASALTDRLPRSVKSVPMSFANLKDIYIPRGWKPGDLMVINVQDAHGNAEAQANIARIIESFAKRTEPSVSGGKSEDRPYSPLIVGVEGARGAFNFHPYRSFPDPAITKEVAKYLLKDSFITGAEYAGMTLGLAAREPEASDVFNAAAETRPGGAQPPVTFWGIEKEDLYLSHVQAFKDSIAHQKQAEEKHKAFAELLRKVKDRKLNAVLREMDAKMALHRKQQIGLGAYIKYLSEVSRKSGAAGGVSPMIDQLTRALALEESMDYKKVEKERRGLTNALTQKLPRAELKNLVEASLSYRLGNLTHGSFYQYLKELCQTYGVSLAAWPEMDKYVRYVLISEKIKPEQLFSDIEAMEKAALRANAKTAEEKEILQLSQDLTLVEKLVAFGLSPKEWEMYESRRDDIRAIPGRLERYLGDVGGVAVPGNENDVDQGDLFQLLSKFEGFNKAAIARNEALVGSLLAKAGDEFGAARSGSVAEAGTSEKIALMVTGGFHTDGVTEILRGKQIAYAVLMPRLGKIEGDGTEYLDFFTRDKTPLEKLFSGDRITLAYPSGMSAPIGSEVPVRVFVAERNFTLLAALKYARKTLSEYPAMAPEVLKAIRDGIGGWFANLKTAGFMTLGGLRGVEVQDQRDAYGKPSVTTLEAELEGANGQNSSAIRAVYSSKDASAQPASDSAVAFEIGGDKVQISAGKPGLMSRLGVSALGSKLRSGIAAAFNAAIPDLSARSEIGSAGVFVAASLGVSALGLAATFMFGWGILGAIASVAAGLAVTIAARLAATSEEEGDWLDRAARAGSQKEKWESALASVAAEIAESPDQSWDYARISEKLDPALAEYLRELSEFRRFFQTVPGQLTARHDRDLVARQERLQRSLHALNAVLAQSDLYVYPLHNLGDRTVTRPSGNSVPDDSGPDVTLLPMRIADRATSFPIPGGKTLRVLQLEFLNAPDESIRGQMPLGFSATHQQGDEIHAAVLKDMVKDQVNQVLELIENIESGAAAPSPANQAILKDIRRHFPGAVNRERLEALVAMSVWIHEARHAIDDYGVSDPAAPQARDLREASGYLAEVALGPLPHFWLGMTRDLFAWAEAHKSGQAPVDANNRGEWLTLKLMAEAAGFAVGALPANGVPSVTQLSGVLEYLADLDIGKLRAAARTAYQKNFGDLEAAGYDAAMVRAALTAIHREPASSPAAVSLPAIGEVVSRNPDGTMTARAVSEFGEGPYPSIQYQIQLRKSADDALTIDKIYGDLFREIQKAANEAALKRGSPPGHALELTIRIDMVERTIQMVNVRNSSQYSDNGEGYAHGIRNLPLKGKVPLTPPEVDGESIKAAAEAGDLASKYIAREAIRFSELLPGYELKSPFTVGPGLAIGLSRYYGAEIDPEIAPQRANVYEKAGNRWRVKTRSGSFSFQEILDDTRALAAKSGASSPSAQASAQPVMDPAERRIAQTRIPRAGGSAIFNARSGYGEGPFPAIDYDIYLAHDGSGPTIDEVYGDLFREIQAAADAAGSPQARALNLKVRIDMISRTIELQNVETNTAARLASPVSEKSGIVSNYFARESAAFSRHFPGYRVVSPNTIGPGAAIGLLRHYDRARIVSVTSSKGQPSVLAGRLVTGGISYSLRDIIEETRRQNGPAPRGNEEFAFGIRSMRLAAFVPVPAPSASPAGHPAAIFYNLFRSRVQGAPAPATLSGKILHQLGRLGDPHFAGPLFETAAFAVLGYALTSVGNDIGFLWATGVFSILHAPGIIASWRARAKDRGQATDAQSMLRSRSFHAFFSTQLLRTFVASILFYAPFPVLSYAAEWVSSYLDSSSAVSTALKFTVVLPATLASGFMHLYYNLRFFPVQSGKLPDFLAARGEMESRMNADQVEGLVFIDGNGINMMNQLVGKAAVNHLLDHLMDALIRVRNESGALVWRQGGDEFAAAIPKGADAGAVMRQIQSEVESRVYLPYILSGTLDKNLERKILDGGGAVSTVGGQTVVLVKVNPQDMAAADAIENELRPSIGADENSDVFGELRGSMRANGRYLSLTLSMGYAPAGQASGVEAVNKLLEAAAADKDAKKNQGKPAASGSAREKILLVEEEGESAAKIRTYLEEIGTAASPNRVLQDRNANPDVFYFADQQSWRDAVYRQSVFQRFKNLLPFGGKYGPTVLFTIVPGGYEGKGSKPEVEARLAQEVERKPGESRLENREFKALNDGIDYEEGDKILALLRHDVAMNHVFQGYQLLIARGPPSGPLIALVPKSRSTPPIRPGILSDYAQKVVDAAYEATYESAREEVHVRPTHVMTVWDAVRPGEGVGPALSRMEKTRYVKESVPLSQRPRAQVFSYGDANFDPKEADRLELKRSAAAAGAVAVAGIAAVSSAQPGAASASVDVQDAVSRENLRDLAEEYLTGLPQEDLLGIVRSATGNNSIDVVNRMAVEYFAEGSRKWVFRVMVEAKNGAKIRLMLAMKKGKPADRKNAAITGKEIDNLKKLSGLGATPRFISQFKVNSGYEGFIEEFVDGDTARALFMDEVPGRQMTPAMRASIVTRVFEITKALKGEAPKDLNNENFIIRAESDEAVMVDIGDSRLRVFNSSDPDPRHPFLLLAILISQYGFTTGKTGENQFIFDALVKVFGAEAINYLADMKNEFDTFSKYQKARDQARHGEKSNLEVLQDYLFTDGGKMMDFGANQRGQNISGGERFTNVVTRTLLRDLDDYLRQNPREERRGPQGPESGARVSAEQLESWKESGERVEMTFPDPDAPGSMITRVGTIEDVSVRKYKKSNEIVVYLSGYMFEIIVDENASVRPVSNQESTDPAGSGSGFLSEMRLRFSGAEGQASSALAAGLGLVGAGAGIAFWAGAGALGIIGAGIAGAAIFAAVYFLTDRFRAGEDKSTALKLPVLVQNLKQSSSSNVRKAVDALVALAAESQPERIEDRLRAAASRLDAFRAQDMSSQNRNALRLVALWALFNGTSLKGITDRREIEAGQLSHTIQFKFSGEMASVIEDFESLAEIKRSAPRQLARSRGVSAWDYFFYGGAGSQDSAESPDLDAAIAMYETARGSLEPDYIMSRGRKDIAKRIWNQGRSMASAMRASPLINVRRDRELADRYEESGPAQVLLHKVHRMSDNELSILAQGILRQEERISRGEMKESDRNIFLLDIGKLKITREELRDSLRPFAERQGVDSQKFDAMFDAVFSRDFSNYMINDSDLFRAQTDLSPSIKRDTDALYGIVLLRARRVGSDPLIRSVAVDILTDEMIYTETWQQSLGIRILLIVSQTQVVVFSHSLGAALRESDIVAMQQ